MKPKKGNGPFTCFSLFLFALVLFVLSIYKYSDDADIRANGVQITATVTGVYKSAITSGEHKGRNIYEIWIEYTFNGEAYTADFDEYYSTTLKAGDEVDIIVDKSKPDRWCQTSNPWGVVRTACGVFTALFGLMWIHFLVGWVRWKRRNNNKKTDV